MHRTALPGIVPLLLVVSGVGSALAQVQVQPPDPVRLATAHRVLEASGATELMISAVKANIAAQRTSAPQLPAEFWSRFLQRVDQDAPQLIDSIAVLYATTFTASELEQLALFYESPIGRRLRQAQPTLVTESAAIGQRWGMRIGAEIGQTLSR